MATVIDEYLLNVSDPARGTFEAVRKSIHAHMPGLEECMSYGIPAFRTSRGIVAGIAVNKKFCSYYPFSGSVLDRVGQVIDGYSRTKSALHFALDEPLPPAIVEVLMDARMSQLSEN